MGGVGWVGAGGGLRSAHRGDRGNTYTLCCGRTFFQDVREVLDEEGHEGLLNLQQRDEGVGAATQEVASHADGVPVGPLLLAALVSKTETQT